MSDQLNNNSTPATSDADVQKRTDLLRKHVTSRETLPDANFIRPIVGNGVNLADTKNGQPPLIHAMITQYVEPTNEVPLSDGLIR